MRRKQQDRVIGVRFDGLGTAHATPEVLGLSSRRRCSSSALRIHWSVLDRYWHYLKFVKRSSDPPRQKLRSVRLWPAKH